MIKKRLLLILLLLIICVGCASSADKVKLYNKTQANRAVNRKFGKAKYIDTTKGENEVTYTFEDKELKFQYDYKCYASSVSIDGSTFGYTQSFSTTYYKEYYNYINDEIKSDKDDISRKYDVQIEMVENWNNNYLLATIRSNVNDNDKAFEAGLELKELYKKYDTRKVFNSSQITVEQGINGEGKKILMNE